MNPQKLTVIEEQSPNSLASLETWTQYYQSKYGADFNLNIAETDEMFLHFYGVIKSIPSEHSDHFRAWLNYFVTGERIYSSILDLAAEQFLKESVRVLDFASGYGRVARFFNRLKGVELIASDIDAKAMDFCAKELGLYTERSSFNPEDYRQDSRFDLIYVVSLFSHFSIDPWDVWMRKVISALDESGVLIFSYHGERLLTDAEKSNMECQAEGFYFFSANETRGRIDSNYYGTCYLSPHYLEDYFSGLCGIEFEIVDQGIGGVQDVCVIRKTTI